MESVDVDPDELSDAEDPADVSVDDDVDPPPDGDALDCESVPPDAPVLDEAPDGPRVDVDAPPLAWESPLEVEDPDVELLPVPQAT